MVLAGLTGHLVEKCLKSLYNQTSLASDHVKPANHNSLVYDVFSAGLDTLYIFFLYEMKSEHMTHVLYLNKITDKSHYRPQTAKIQKSIVAQIVWVLFFSFSLL